MEALLQDLHARLQEIEQNIFQFPPADWAAFQERRGEWTGVMYAIQTIQDKLKRDDE